MNTDASIVEFFYNVIPGSLFIVLMSYFKIFDVSSLLSFNKQPDSLVLIFLYLFLGLTSGFIFQGMTKLARKYLMWNYNVMSNVIKKKENEKKFIKVKKSLDIGANVNDEEKLIATFYFMDNWLRGEKAAFQVNHFSSRFAFWSNTFFALLAFFLLISIKLCFAKKIMYFIFLFRINGPIILLLIGLLFYSNYMSSQYLEGFYDSMFKSFYMLTVFNKRNNTTSVRRRRQVRR